MRILVVGGGSGGHVTPALAILEVLAAKDPHLQVLFVCDKKFAPQATQLLATAPFTIPLKTVAAGKFRRYHGIPLWKQLLDLPTLCKNSGDAFLLAIGLVQSWGLIGRFKPDVVFTKGGFVCLPVGIAAHWRRVPLVIHDSDAHPGLTNRILARYAAAIATGAPLHNYGYPAAKSHYTGIPVSADFRAVTDHQKQQLKKQVQQHPTRPLVVVTGGGLGAERINKAVLSIASDLTQEGFEVLHITGHAHYRDSKARIAAQQPEGYQAVPFVDSLRMSQLFKAADVVVSRAGATAMAELASLHKAVILVPNPHLTGGHQLKNAQVWQEAEAAVVLDEAQMEKNAAVLKNAIVTIVSQPHYRHQLEQRISAFSQVDAAQKVAELIMRQGRGVA